jgi:AraC family transcriptional regulator, transcriptional activator of pobA
MLITTITHRTDLNNKNGLQRAGFFSILIVEQATGVYQIDEHRFALLPHTFYFASPEQVQHLMLDGAEAAGYCLQFQGGFLEQYTMPLSRMNGLQLFFNCDETRPLSVDVDADWLVLKGHATRMEQEMQSENTPLRSELLGTLLKLLLLDCARIKAAHGPKGQASDNRQTDIVRRFKQLVDEQYNRLHLVNDYANLLHLTSNHLNEVVKSETGTSAKDFIQNRILMEAKRFALDPEMTAKEVAFALGYEDATHFSKFFKRCAGVSFSEYRESV